MSAMIVNLVLLSFGLFFLYTGVVGFVQPKRLGAMVSLTPEGRSGLIEIRAQYGGFFFAAGLSQLAPFTGLLSTEAALIIALVIFGGLIVARLAALFLDAGRQPLTSMMKLLFVIDGAGFAAVVLALFLHRPTSHLAI